MVDPLEGDMLGVALERLRQAARIDLPQLADEFAVMASHLETAAQHDGNFARPEYFGDGDPSTGIFGEKWIELRDLMWTAAADTGNNFWDLGETLDMAVDSYEETDTAAGDEMRKRASELNDSSDESCHEWEGGYDKPDTPDWVEPHR